MILSFSVMIFISFFAGHRGQTGRSLIKNIHTEPAADCQPFLRYAYLRPVSNLPHVPAHSIAWLALHAPKEFSGTFMSYDDPLISRPSQAVFGEKTDMA
jgi:hypothetical protein